MCKIKIPEMTESEWDKLWGKRFSKEMKEKYDVAMFTKSNGWFKKVKAVGDRREQKLKTIKKREPFCCGYPIIDELDRNNYVAVFRCGNCFRIWVEFLGVEE